MKTIPFLSLSHQHGQIRSAVQEAVMSVYDRNSFVIGESLESFEDEFARFTGVKFCIGTGNGLDALTLALRSCDLSADDEVIVPAHTFIATWLAVSRCGARIVPVEPDETLNIDPSKIEAAITSKTKIILPVHLYGQPCDMDAIAAIAKKNNLLIVEDNAQAQGAKWGEKLTGSYGIVNATSFYPAKNLGALGDGGAITTSDQSKAERIRQLRNYGFAEKNVAVEQGINSRLDEVQAAVLRIKLKHLDEWNEDRRRLALIYQDKLSNTGDIVLPPFRRDAFHVYHLFVIRTRHRESLKTFLTARGIETMIHYPVLPHLQGAYRNLNFKKGDFPVAERVAETVLSLPLWPGLSDEDIFYVVEMIKEYFKKR